MPYNDDGEWVMPEWMESYRDAIERGAGGNSAENLMTRLEQEDNLGFSNQIVLAMALQVQAKINLLGWLRQQDHLRGVVGDLQERIEGFISHQRSTMPDESEESDWQAGYQEALNDLEYFVLQEPEAFEDLAEELEEVGNG